MSNLKQYYKPGFQKKVPYLKMQAMSRAQFRQRIAAKQQLPKYVPNKERKYSDRAVSGYQVSDAGQFSLLHVPTLEVILLIELVEKLIPNLFILEES